MIGEPEEHFGEAAKRHCLVVAEHVVDETRKIAAKKFAGSSGRLAAGYQAQEFENGAAIGNPSSPFWSYVEFGHAIANQYGEVEGERVGQRAHVRPAIEAVRKLRS
ncbi:MAG TPA: hypothetical protein VE326_11495 [Candidatus Binatia bacterium]|nr:hypothetical protein [Candidatus Binatia bacterium]